MEKVDGSLISVWFNTVDQKWEISTRSSIFGDAVVGLNSRTTFRELVLKVFPTFSDFFAKCDDQKTYIFEYIGPDNRIVTAYVNLLSLFPKKLMFFLDMTSLNWCF